MKSNKCFMYRQFAASTHVSFTDPAVHVNLKKLQRLSVGDKQQSSAHLMAWRGGSCWGAEQGLEFSLGDFSKLATWGQA